MEAALSRGWTSISEQWVNQERIDELEALAADDALPLRVDAYLALNFDKDFYGDWYASREPGPVDDHLRVQGLKIHLDDGSGNTINWEPADLTETIARADEAGWQVSVHAMSYEAPGAAPRRLRGGARPGRAEPAPPPGRARPPGDGRAAGPPGGHGHPHGDPPRRRRRLGARRGLPRRVRPRQPRRGARLAHPLARLRGRRAARRLGDRRAVDLSGLQADRRHGSAGRPDRRRDGRAGSLEPGDAAVVARPAADRRAGAAGGDRSTRRTRSATSRGAGTWRRARSATSRS